MDSSKKTLLVLVAAFVAPILLGTFFFYNMEDLGVSRGTVNYGTLVKPATPTRIEGLMQSGEAALPENTLSKKWTMIYIAQNECNQFCQDRLLLIKRVRILMNEQMRRVRTLLISNSPTLDVSIKEKNRDLVHAYIHADNSTFIEQFPDLEKSPVYLLDPLGNLMMYYPQENPDAKKMIKDLQRLLKYSHLG